MMRLRAGGIRRFFPAMTREGWWFILLLAFGIMTVVTGYTSLSETDDELYHVECGTEWLHDGTYAKQPLHPPLARVMDASLVVLHDKIYGPFVAATKRDSYMTKMVLSRLGTLPYYILSCVLVFLWARRLFGEDAALWSLAGYVTLSSVTAHAMLATTDMGYTAMFLWALYVTVLWLEEPSYKRSLWLGVSLALMVGTKFSGLLHWPLALAVLLLIRVRERWQEGRGLWPLGGEHVRNGLLMVAPGFIFVLWLVYRCDFGPLVQGVKDALDLDKTGYGVWFYGPLNNMGVWQFFPVVFFFKTPLAFFAFSVMGAWFARKDREALFPLLAAAVVLLSSMTSHINLGVRHVLPMYPLMAIGAGYGAWRLWHAGTAWRVLAAGLAVWQFAGFCMYQPEHLAYFNIAAGEHPERITLDSDFDWGQSVIMLDEELQRRGVKEVALCARKDAVWSAYYVIAAKTLPCPTGPVQGWVAVSRAYRLLNPDNFAWLARVPGVEKIGKTMDLYYLPPRNAPRTPPMRRPAPKPQPKPKAKTAEHVINLPPTPDDPAFSPQPNMTPIPMQKPTLTLPATQP